MAMREKYTKPSASITTTWSSGIRPSSPGPTSARRCWARPTGHGPDGAVRKEIFKNWKSLGLRPSRTWATTACTQREPFEALAERLNWMGATLDDDSARHARGHRRHDHGVTKDPQVPFEEEGVALRPARGLDYDECLAKAQAIAGVKGSARRARCRRSSSSSRRGHRAGEEAGQGQPGGVGR